MNKISARHLPISNKRLYKTAITAVGVGKFILDLLGFTAFSIVFRNQMEQLKQARLEKDIETSLKLTNQAYGLMAGIIQDHIAASDILIKEFEKYYRNLDVMTDKKDLLMWFDKNAENFLSNVITVRVGNGENIVDHTNFIKESIPEISKYVNMNPSDKDSYFNHVNEFFKYKRAQADVIKKEGGVAILFYLLLRVVFGYFLWELGEEIYQASKNALREGNIKQVGQSVFRGIKNGYFSREDFERVRAEFENVVVNVFSGLNSALQTIKTQWSFSEDGTQRDLSKYLSPDLIENVLSYENAVLSMFKTNVDANNYVKEFFDGIRKNFDLYKNIYNALNEVDEQVLLKTPDRFDSLFKGINFYGASMYDGLSALYELSEYMLNNSMILIETIEREIVLLETNEQKRLEYGMVPPEFFDSLNEDVDNVTQRNRVQHRYYIQKNNQNDLMSDDPVEREVKTDLLGIIGAFQAIKRNFETLEKQLRQITAKWEEYIQWEGTQKEPRISKTPQER